MEQPRAEAQVEPRADEQQNAEGQERQHPVEGGERGQVDEDHLGGRQPEERVARVEERPVAQPEPAAEEAGGEQGPEEREGEGPPSPRRLGGCRVAGGLRGSGLLVESQMGLSGQQAEEHHERQRRGDGAHEGVQRLAGSTRLASHEDAEAQEGDDREPRPERRIQDRRERPDVQRQVADEKPQHGQGEDRVAAQASERRGEARTQPEQQHPLDPPGEGDAVEAELHGDGQGDEAGGQAEGDAALMHILRPPAESDQAEHEVHGGEAERRGAQPTRVLVVEDPIEHRPGERGGHEVAADAGSADRSAQDETARDQREQVEGRHRQCDEKGVPRAVRLVVAVEPGHRGDRRHRAPHRFRPRPTRSYEGREARLGRQKPQQGHGPVGRPREAYRPQAAGHERRRGKDRGRGRIGKCVDDEEQRRPHEPGRRDAETLGAVEGSAPDQERNGGGERRHHGEAEAEAAGLAQRERRQTERKDHHELGPVHLGDERRRPHRRDQQDETEAETPLLARHAESEEAREEHQAGHRHLEPLGTEVLSEPAGVEDHRAEEGQRHRLRPGLPVFEDERARPEHQQVGEEALGPVFTGREEHRRQVTADPGEGGEQAAVEAIGNRHPASGHDDHEQAGRALRNQVVEAVGPERGHVEAGKADGRQALPEGPILPAHQPDPPGEHPQAREGAEQDATRGPDPVVLPGVADEQAEERDEGEGAHRHEQPRPEVRGEVRHGGGRVRGRRGTRKGPARRGRRPGRGSRGRRGRRLGFGRPRGGRHDGARHCDRPRGTRRGGGRVGRDACLGGGLAGGSSPEAGGRVPQLIEPRPQLLDFPLQAARSAQGDDGQDRRDQGQACQPEGEQREEPVHLLADLAGHGHEAHRQDAALLEALAPPA